MCKVFLWSVPYFSRAERHKNALDDEYLVRNRNTGASPLAVRGVRDLQFIRYFLVWRYWAISGLVRVWSLPMPERYCWGLNVLSITYIRWILAVSWLLSLFQTDIKRSQIAQFLHCFFCFTHGIPSSFQCQLHLSCLINQLKQKPHRTCNWCWTWTFVSV